MQHAFKNTRRHFIVDFGRFYHIFNAPASLQVGGSKKDDAAVASSILRSSDWDTFWNVLAPNFKSLINS